MFVRDHGREIPDPAQAESGYKKTGLLCCALCAAEKPGKRFTSIGFFDEDLFAASFDRDG